MEHFWEHLSKYCQIRFQAPDPVHSTPDPPLVFAINRISACNIASSICLLRRVRLHTWARTTLRHSPSLRSPQSDI